MKDLKLNLRNIHKQYFNKEFTRTNRQDLVKRSCMNDVTLRALQEEPRGVNDFVIKVQHSNQVLCTWKKVKI